METLTKLTAEQKAELEGYARELKVLSKKLEYFRQSNGDLRGLVDSASGFAFSAGSELEELVSRTQPSAKPLSRRRVSTELRQAEGFRK